ncbi:hypothetical protein PHMEG_00024654 [Phytophthora megakarya]|uniref:DDE-1 domain-containing protein n=1 Tax=Phytophthora megakarya TaxID=4795 RepID=A0A225VFD8_9STRA|nr:hypothetical protein PHMEG_00024654 [Phytophthora megakarya]
MVAHRIVPRTQSGKKSVSPEKQASIERVAKHLANLQRGFEPGEYDEDTVENIEETHFVVDFNNNKTLGFKREENIKYADVVSGGEGMTMLVRISSGASGHIHPPMMILHNAGSNYPIKGVPYSTPGVSYRTGPKGWMSQRGYERHEREKHIFLDNCTSHLDDDQCENELARLKARLVYFPANTTELCQPTDSFVIAKIKDAWRRKWNERKITLIEGEEWQNA